MGKHIVVPAQSAQADYLQVLKRLAIPELDWQTVEDAETTELMRLVRDQSVDIAIVNSVEYAVNSALFPQVRDAFPAHGYTTCHGYCPEVMTPVCWIS